MNKKQELQQAKVKQSYYDAKAFEFYEQSCYKLGDIMAERADYYKSRIKFLETTKSVWDNN